MNTITPQNANNTRGKLFKYALIAVIVLFVLVLGVSIIQYADYLQGQSCAVALMEVANDEYDNFNGSHNELVKKMYRDLRFSGTSYADTALGEALGEMGYSCYWGSYYMKYVGLFGFFPFTVESCIDHILLCIGYILAIVSALALAISHIVYTQKKKL